MKFYISTLYIMLCGGLLCMHLPATATHIIGAELTYRCLGNNVYEFKVRYYKDCQSIPFYPMTTIQLESTACGESLSLQLLPVAGSQDTASAHCTPAMNGCNGGFITGFEYLEYTGIDTLTVCADWQFTWFECCRNAAPTNVSIMGPEMLIVHATLDNTIGCNNSPEWNDEALIFACADSLATYDLGSTDMDGDSVVYGFYHALADLNGSLVPYTPPFDPASFLTSLVPISLDSSSGLLTMHAAPGPAFEISIMAMRANEYRNGSLIGSIARDHMVFTIPDPVGIQEQDPGDVTVYSDPARGIVIIHDGIEEGTVLLIDVRGREVMRAEPGKGQTELSTVRLTPGVYMVRVESGGKRFFKRILVGGR